MDIQEFLFGKPNRRGTVYIEAIGGGLLNRGQEICGHYEVEILEETDKLYRVKWADHRLNRDFPSWIEKNSVDLITAKKD